MENDNDEKLILSEWITFLSSESAPAISNILSLGAFVFAGFAIIKTTTNSTWIATVCGGLTGVALVFSFWKVGSMFGRNARQAHNMLYRIMSGELRNPSKIEKEWKDFLDKQKAKKPWLQEVGGKVRKGWDIIVKRKEK